MDRRLDPRVAPPFADGSGFGPHHAARPPLPALAPFVATLWAAGRGALAHARELNLPNGGVDLVIALQQPALTRFADAAAASGDRFSIGVLQGVHDRPTWRDTATASQVVGAHLRAGAPPALLGDRADLLANRTVGLDAIWGASARGLREQLAEIADPWHRLDALEAHLLARLRDAPAPDPLAAWVLQRLGQAEPGQRIGALQHASGLSPVRFIARYRQACGLAPKHHARVLRLQRVLALAAPAAAGPREGRHTAPDWRDIAAQTGFADQAHLVREFNRLTGMAPGAYRPLRADQPTHMAA